jgi:D-xylose 1-dehydrogenase
MNDMSTLNTVIERPTPRARKATATVTAPYALYPSLANKHVLVTGGGTGIGATLVTAFAGQGANVSFLDIADEASLALEAQLRGAAHAPNYTHCDLTDLEALARTLRHVEDSRGPIDILINNAANDTRHAVEAVTPQQWDASIAVNLRHQFFCAQAVLPGMKAAGSGVILNMGSISWHRALPDLALYMTAKAAIEGLTRGLARDLGPHNIRVNSVIPGAVRTPRQTMLWHTPEEEARIVDGQCLKQRVEPEHVAALTLFLSSDNAASCTGREYFVDAGWYGA